MTRSHSNPLVRTLLIGALSIGIVLNVVYISIDSDVHSINDVQIEDDSDSGHRSHPWSFTMDDEIEMILKGLTVREKIAQMTQLDIAWLMNGHDRDPATALNHTRVILYAKWGIGSILNSPFPVENSSRTDWTAAEWKNITDQIKTIYKQYSKTPMIYGIDTIHGASFIRNATLFPQPLSAGASFRPDLIYKMGEIEAKDTIDGGIPWIFSPVLGIAVQPKWSRVYETFGEDPHVASIMGANIIRGIQASGKVAACMKHFIGYSNVVDGLDRTDSEISDFDLLNYYVPSFLAATKAGVKTAMETYISINGEPVIASHKMLTQLLRNDMNFEGMMVSDYSEVDRLVFEHHGVSTVEEANRIVFNQTSLDMNMGPNPIKFMDSMENFVKSGEITEERLDESVRRILELKKKLGLLDAHFKTQETETLVAAVEKSPLDQAVALEIARESIVLVENNASALPIQLDDSENTIFLTGPTSDNIGYMCGGWSVWWQGSSDSSVFPYGMTFKDAMVQRTKNTKTSIEHLNVVDVDGGIHQPDFDKALEIAARSKYTVVVLGEGNYAEKSGDTNDLTLPLGQLHYLRALIEIKTTKVVLVLVTGRPRTLQDAHLGAAAVLVSFLPCEQGGQALSEVLFGDINPSGKLPITYPKDNGNTMPYFHRVNVVCNPWDNCPVEWPFFHGLSYTTFNQTVRPPTSGKPIQLKVTNTGTRPGSEVAALFVHQTYRLINVPEVWKLRAFEKVHLEPGESKIVTFNLTDEELFGYYVPQIGQGFRMQVDTDNTTQFLYYGSRLPPHPDWLDVTQYYNLSNHRIVLSGDIKTGRPSSTL